MNKYLKEDSKNITCSLLKIIEKDIPQIAKFSFAA